MYLQYAEDAERKARGFTGDEREQMREIARRWRQLARETGELPVDDPRLADPPAD